MTRFNEFALRDYELKVRYLTDHFGRMWTGFDYFVGIESTLAGGKQIFGDEKISAEIAIVGVVVSLRHSAEDRFLESLDRGHVTEAADLIDDRIWNSAGCGPCHDVGAVAESSKKSE